MKRNATVFGVLFALFCSATVLAQSPTSSKDPRIGTWKLNVGKSTYAQGIVPPQMEVRSIAERPDGFTVFSQVGLSPQGYPIFTHLTYKIDGKAYPYYNQDNLADFSATGAKLATNTYRLPNPSTVELTVRDNTGNVTATMTHVVSSDGKTLTSTVKDATGKVANVTVWDKQ